MDIAPTQDGGDVLLLLQGSFVVSARPYDSFPPGQISMSDAQRTWMGIALTDLVNAELFDPFANGGQAYLGSMDMEIGFASQKKQEQKPYDQDELAKVVTGVCVAGLG
jgi:vesicle-fusing ATPase